MVVLLAQQKRRPHYLMYRQRFWYSSIYSAAFSSSSSLSLSSSSSSSSLLSTSPISLLRLLSKRFYYLATTTTTTTCRKHCTKNSILSLRNRTTTETSVLIGRRTIRLQQRQQQFCHPSIINNHYNNISRREFNSSTNSSNDDDDDDNDDVKNTSNRKKKAYIRSLYRILLRQCRDIFQSNKDGISVGASLDDDDNDTKCTTTKSSSSVLLLQEPLNPNDWGKARTFSTINKNQTTNSSKANNNNNNNNNSDATFTDNYFLNDDDNNERQQKQQSLLIYEWFQKRILLNEKNNEKNKQILNRIAKKEFLQHFKIVLNDLLVEQEEQSQEQKDDVMSNDDSNDDDGDNDADDDNNKNGSSLEKNILIEITKEIIDQLTKQQGSDDELDYVKLLSPASYDDRWKKTNRLYLKEIEKRFKDQLFNQLNTYNNLWVSKNDLINTIRYAFRRKGSTSSIAGNNIDSHIMLSPIDVVRILNEQELLLQHTKITTNKDKGVRVVAASQYIASTALTSAGLRASTNNAAILNALDIRNQKDKDDDIKYRFAYRIRVENMIHNNKTVQLLGRTWHIHEKQHKQQQQQQIENNNSDTCFDTVVTSIDAPTNGAVGHLPVLHAGDVFVYMSGCDIKTKMGGYMDGCFHMSVVPKDTKSSVVGDPNIDALQDVNQHFTVDVGPFPLTVE